MRTFHVFVRPSSHHSAFMPRAQSKNCTPTPKISLQGICKRWLFLVRPSRQSGQFLTASMSCAVAMYGLHQLAWVTVHSHCTAFQCIVKIYVEDHEPGKGLVRAAAVAWTALLGIRMECLFWYAPADICSSPSRSVRIVLSSGRGCIIASEWRPEAARGGMDGALGQTHGVLALVRPSRCL